MLKRGDKIQLKVPQHGRRYKGTLVRIGNGQITSSLSNGLEATQPADLWELVEEQEGENKLNNNDEELS